MNEIAESPPNLNAKKPNIFNPGCLVTQSAVALRCLQCYNVCLHIPILFVSAGSRCCLNPAASSVSHSSVRKALYISLCCALSIPLLLFFLSSLKDSTVRVSNGKQERKREIESSTVRFRNPFYRLWDPP